ncbi:unnamed protein product [Paramecium octaurelia]|uniref:Uncharacterized protein n=1 Tax=Paramecium octaurelia TaxID=43137 RepID=A0A8S1YHF3_PAROT|nr:unnamed protein product [Paramecium octaurelia]
MSRFNTQSQFGPNQGALGIQQSFQQKNQHEIVNKTKNLQEMKTELEREKDNSIMYQKLLEKALKEIQQYINRFGSYTSTDDDENESKQEASHLRTEFTWKKLQPLLDGYDEQIAEQKHIIEIYKQDISQLEQLSKQFVEENQSLREQLEKKCEIILNIFQNGTIQDQMANLYKRLQKDDWAEKVKELTQENHTLLKNYKEVLGKVKELQRDCDLYKKQLKEHQLKNEKLSAEINEIRDLKQEYQRKYEDLLSSNKDADSKIREVKNKNVKFEQDNMKLILQYEELDKRYQTLVNDSESQKKDFEFEIDSLGQEISDKSRKIKELQAENISINKERDQFSNDAKNFQQKLHEEEQESKKKQLLIDDLTRKIDLLQKRETEHIKLSHQRAEKESKLIQEIDDLDSTNRQQQQQIESMTQSHDKQIESLKHDKDKVIEQQKVKYTQQIQNQDSKIEELEQSLNQKEIINEKLQKENNRLKQEKEDYEQNIKVEKYRLEHENSNLKQKNQELEESIVRREQYYEDKIQGLRMDKEQLELQNKNINQLTNELKQQNEQLRKKANLIEVENYELKEKVNQQGRSIVQGTNSKIMRSYVPT